jgi:hypothetical protein
MNEQEQRIAIAKACGWTKFTPDTIQYTARRADGKWDVIPDYPRDLNAMRKAREQALTTPQLKADYARTLKSLTWNSEQPEYGAVNATAAQQAEALLRCLNLWKP